MDVDSNFHSNKVQSLKDPKNDNNDKKSTSKDSCDPFFVNKAEIAWQERRKAWVGERSQKSQRIYREPIMSWTTTYEELLSSTEPFHQPIPLAEMVDFLVDNWLDEGLYD